MHFRCQRYLVNFRARVENARGEVFVRGEERRGEPRGAGWAAAVMPALARLRSLPTPHARRGTAAALQRAIDSPAARKIRISSTSSERGQKSKQTRDTTASAHQMGAGAGSGRRPRVTALPGVLLGGFWAILHARGSSQLRSQLRNAAQDATGERNNQRRHNTHTGGLSLRLSLDSPGSVKLRSRDGHPGRGRRE